MRWQSYVLNMPRNGLNQLNAYFAQHGDKTLCVMRAGGGISESLHNNEVNHLAVTTYKTADFHVGTRGREIEPSYSQKLLVLKELGKWGEVAVEVMPIEFEVVDVENVYHLWEFQYLYSFCVNPAPIFEAPPTFELNFEGMQYHVDIKPGGVYIYFKDKENMPWWKKQRLKNYVTTPVSIGVEFICEAMANVDYGCIVVLPPLELLDFGLEQPLY